MIDAIYIPTLGRSQNQITFDNMTENAQRVTRLVVQPKEKDLYPNYPILVLPENDIGITATRRWIYEYAADQKYCVADDDVLMIARKPWHYGEKTKRTMTAEDWDYFLNTTSDWLDDVSFGGTRRGNLPPTGIEYLESAPAACFFFFNGLALPRADELDWSLPVCEDIHMVLQLFKKGYNNRVWDRFGYISNILVDGGGGCNEWRTLKIINDTHEKLISYYPNHVSWNGIRENVMGGDFKKIKIKWKRMYLDSQISNLEEFMNDTHRQTNELLSH